MEETKNILGISLGTRSIGISVICDGELYDWSIKTFKGIWNEHKRDTILEVVDQMAERYDIDRFAIKVPDQIGRHGTVGELYVAINVYAQHNDILTETYTMNDLKGHFGEEVRNKAMLWKATLKIFPDLKDEVTKESLNRRSYYFRLFESALAGHLLFHTTKQN